MKKIITILAIAMSVTTASLAGGEKVAPRVLDAFKTEFSTATEVTWMVADSYYRAAFTLNGQKVFAYYDMNNDFIGLARYITTLQLPIHLLAGLKNHYGNYWVNDLFEISKEDGTHYYITLENADATVKLKSSNGEDWETYDKKRKA